MLAMSRAPALHSRIFLIESEEGLEGCDWVRGCAFFSKSVTGSPRRTGANFLISNLLITWRLRSERQSKIPHRNASDTTTALHGMNGPARHEPNNRFGVLPRMLCTGNQVVNEESGVLVPRKGRG